MLSCFSCCANGAQSDGAVRGSAGLRVAKAERAHLEDPDFAQGRLADLLVLVGLLRDRALAA